MCAPLGGCSGDITRFAPSSIATITAFAASATCLDDVPSQPPSIASVSPGTVSSHGAGTITVNGNNLDPIDTIAVGPARLTSFTVVSANQVTLRLPDPFPIATHTVTATNRAGTSNGVPLTVTGNHPSELEAPSAHPLGTTRPYRVYTDDAWRAVLLVSTSNAPSVLPGIVGLGIGSGFSSLLHVATLLADNRGFAELQVPIGAAVAPQTTWWQAVTFDPGDPTLPLEVSNVESVPLF